MRPAWSFVATDIDSVSLDYARVNVEVNKLRNRIRLLARDQSENILAIGDAAGSIDFTMCNPPFYASVEEMQSSMLHDGQELSKPVVTQPKTAPPAAVCTGSVNEMVYTDGGDAGFVLRIVRESIELQQEPSAFAPTCWFSSMVGKRASLAIIVARLKELNITNWAVTTLRAGQRTRRWAVAWSFADYRPRNVSQVLSAGFWYCVTCITSSTSRYLSYSPAGPHPRHRHQGAPPLSHRIHDRPPTIRDRRSSLSRENANGGS